MSNIFQPLTRSSGGVVPLNIGVGVLGTTVKNQHLNLDTSGAVYAVSGGAVNHHGAGLPFDSNGRLIVSASPTARVDQSIPFTAAGAVAIGGAISYYGQSIAYDVNGALAQ